MYLYLVGLKYIYVGKNGCICWKKLLFLKMEDVSFWGNGSKKTI